MLPRLFLTIGSIWLMWPFSCVKPSVRDTATNKNNEHMQATEKNQIEENLINKRLPKELILRIFSYLNVVSLCRCAQISKVCARLNWIPLESKKKIGFGQKKYWNQLALDGSNWQNIDLFLFQTDVNGKVVEHLSKRCGGFLKTIRLENCKWISDEAIK